MSHTYWTHFEHRADVGIQGVGPDPGKAFAQAGLALMAIMCELDCIRIQSSRNLECTGQDQEMLFFDFINELIYLVSAEGYVFADLQVHIQNQGLKAKAWGESLDHSRHQIGVEVKGASFNNLKVFQNEQGLYLAQCIVDV